MEREKKKIKKKKVKKKKKEKRTATWLGNREVKANLWMDSHGKKTLWRQKTFRFLAKGSSLSQQIESLFAKISSSMLFM